MLCLSCRDCDNPGAVGNDGQAGERPVEMGPKVGNNVSRDMVRTSWKGEIS